MAKHSYDCAGMATKYGVLCGDGRTIMPGAFKDKMGPKFPWYGCTSTILSTMCWAMLC